MRLTLSLLIKGQRSNKRWNKSKRRIKAIVKIKIRGYSKR
jgi:hypothetical protein